MKKVLTIGGATQDVFIQYSPQESIRLHTASPGHCFLMIEEGQKIEVSDLLYHTGGGATNAAVSFQKMGFDTTGFFKIAQDAPGQFILDELKRFNISTVPVISKIGQTGSAFVIPCISGDRIIFVHRGINMTISEDELPYDSMRKSDIIYITSLNGPASGLLLPIVRYAKENQKKVAANPGTAQIRDHAEILKASLAYIDTLIVNATEAHYCMNSLVGDQAQPTNTAPRDAALPYLLQGPVPMYDTFFDVKTFFKEILTRGPQTIVVTNGADGVYAAHNNTIYYHPSIKTEIVSTLGAGDAFGSCFVASLEDGASIENAMRYGVINSSSVIRHIGGKVGLLDADSLKKKAASLDQNLLQSFML
jgi:sugar/nucleoside kinase (ribokinase family)